MRDLCLHCQREMRLWGAQARGSREGLKTGRLHCKDLGEAGVPARSLPPCTSKGTRCTQHSWELPCRTPAPLVIISHTGKQPTTAASKGIALQLQRELFGVKIPLLKTVGGLSHANKLQLRESKLQGSYSTQACDSAANRC